MKVQYTFKSGNTAEYHVPGIDKDPADPPRINIVWSSKPSKEDIAEVVQHHKAGRELWCRQWLQQDYKGACELWSNPPRGIKQQEHS